MELSKSVIRYLNLEFTTKLSKTDCHKYYFANNKEKATDDNISWLENNIDVKRYVCNTTGSGAWEV